MGTTQQDATPKKRWPRWARGFLASLADGGNVRLACEAAKIERSTAYRLRESDETFAAAWNDALDQAADLLEEEARRRAYDGVRRLKFYKGRPVMVPVVDADGLVVKDKDGNPELKPYTEQEYSDTLIIFLLKGARPEKYRERADVQHSGPGGGPIEVSDARERLADKLARRFGAPDPEPDSGSGSRSGAA